jgi:outer membrane protein
MFKKLLSSFCLLFFVVSATAYGQLKIGFMNTQEVLSQMPERSAVEKKLNSFIETQRQEYQQQTMAFQDSVTAFQQNQSSMSQQQREQEQRKLAKMEESLMQLQQNIQTQIEQRRSSLLQPLYNRMDEAIAAVAEERNLDFVLNEATSTGESLIYYSANQTLDITEAVLQQVKETSTQN